MPRWNTWSRPKKEKIYPNALWSKVYTKIDNLIISLRQKGYFVVITARLKPEYIGEEKTGALIMEGYKKLPYLSDIHLKLENGQALVYKNGFRKGAIEQIEPIKSPSFQNIVDELVVRGGKSDTDWDPDITFDDLDMDPDNKVQSDRPEDEKVLCLAAELGMTADILDGWLQVKGKPKRADMSAEVLAKLAEFLESQKAKGKRGAI